MGPPPRAPRVLRGGRPLLVAGDRPRAPRAPAAILWSPHRPRAPRRGAGLAARPFAERGLAALLRLVRGRPRGLVAGSPRGPGLGGHRHVGGGRRRRHARGAGARLALPRGLGARDSAGARVAPRIRLPRLRPLPARGAAFSVCWLWRSS